MVITRLWKLVAIKHNMQIFAFSGGHFSDCGSKCKKAGSFRHVARLRHAVPANQILQICIKARDGERPSQEWRRACGRPHTTWIHQICHDTGVTATEALQLAEDTVLADDRNGGRLRLNVSYVGKCSLAHACARHVTLSTHDYIKIHRGSCSKETYELHNRMIDVSDVLRTALHA